MKRFTLFVLPVLATFVVVGLGLFLFRSQGFGLRPAVEGIGDAIVEEKVE